MFDRVNHDILLLLLEKYGIPVMNRWFLHKINKEICSTSIEFLLRKVQFADDTSVVFSLEQHIKESSVIKTRNTLE